jgi:hypothetical protein
VKISPLQLVHLAFRRVHVAVDVDHMEAAQQDGADAHSMLEGALIKTEVGVTLLEEEDPRGVPYLVTLRVWIDNVHGEDDRERRYSPYLIDIEAGGKIVLRPGGPDCGQRSCAVVVGDSRSSRQSHSAHAAGVRDASIGQFLRSEESPTCAAQPGA